VLNYINAQKDWLTVIHLPKKAPYLNPNKRKVNQRIKSDVCANRFYEHIEDQKAANLNISISDLKAMNNDGLFNDT
jgi:hypothetical protein